MAKRHSFFFFIFRPLAVFLCLALVFFPDPSYAKSKKSARKPYVPPYAHLVLDADTGIVISKQNADQTLYPASLTKLMTLLLTFDALDAKKISLASPVLMSSHAASMPPSRIGLRPGESLSVSNAIKALVTKSANDVAVALGEKIGGSESRFAQMMTRKARDLGMKQTNFINASGLHNSRQVSSARDMAKLALYILHKYPHYYSFFSIEDFYFNGKSHHNHNRLMASYRGMDGMKTGYIAQSGFNLVASAKREGVRLIGVVFGGKTANSRNAQMATLLDDSFSRVSQLRRQSPQSASVSPAPLLQNKGVRPPASAVPPRKPVALTGKPLTSEITANVAPPAAKPQASSLSNPNSHREAVSSQQPMPVSGWAIQIGAFQDRAGTDQALYKALQKLPSPLNRGTAMIVPLRTTDATWVFRARIGGYTKEQALQACRYLVDCLTISPSSN